MKLQSIMLHTTDISVIADLGTPELVFDKDGFDPHVTNPRHIYLIDPNAEIKESDWFIHDNIVERMPIQQIEDVEYRNAHIKDLLAGYNCTKIICSTDESLELPLLSSKSIKFLIDYYNKNGKMIDEVEIEIENNSLNFIPEESSGYSGYRCTDCNKWVYAKNTICDCGKIIKLNSQGTVDIVIDEESCSINSETILSGLKEINQLAKDLTTGNVAHKRANIKLISEILINSIK
jgi:hypothetical protein